MVPARRPEDETMATIAFDTLKYAKRLKDAGFTETQAEALASTEAELIESSLASKRDIKELETKIELLRADLQRDLKEMEYRLTIRLGGLIALAVATVAALVKLL